MTGRSHAVRQARRWMGALLSLTLLAEAGLMHAAEANVWEERRRAVSSQSGPTVVASLPSVLTDAFAAKPAPFVAFPEHMAGGGVPALSGVPAPLRGLPLSLGEVVGVRLAAVPAAPLVILIQDAHQVLSAQRSIDGILSHLRPGVIGIEGAAGDFLIAPYRRLPGQDIQRDIAHALFEKNLLTGAEHYGLTGEKESLFRGLEDPALYMENVNAYRRGLAALPAADAAVGRLQAALDDLKEKHFSPDLRVFDEAVSDHEARRLSLTDYVGAVTAPLPGDVLRRFPQAARFRAALALEKTLDMPVVQRERAELAQILARSLPPKDLQALMQASTAYRAGQVAAGLYHDSLRKSLAVAGIAADRFPAFGAYVRYALAADRVRPAALFDELEGLKMEAARRLARSPEEKALFQAQQDLRLVHSLLRHELTADQWRLYQSRQAAMGALPALVVRPETGWPGLLSSFEDFYRAAAQRDNVLAERFLSSLSEKGVPNGVLIAGGFHSAGLQKALAARGASVVTVTPRIEELPENPTSYLDVFGPSRTPLEKMLLGDRLTTNPPPALAAVLIDTSFKHSQAPNVLYRLLTKLLNGAGAAELGMTARWTERDGVRSASEGGVTALMSSAETPAFTAAAARLAGAFQLNLERGVVAVGRHKIWPAAAAAGGLMAWAALSLWNTLGTEAAASVGAAVPAVQAGAALAVWTSVGVAGLTAAAGVFLRRSPVSWPRPVRKILTMVSVTAAVACGSPVPAAAPAPSNPAVDAASPQKEAAAAEEVLPAKEDASDAAAPAGSTLVPGQVDLRLSEGKFLWHGKPTTIPAVNWRVLGNYGYAFGHGNVKGWFSQPQGVAANAAKVEEGFKKISQAGIKMTRTWLLDDGRAVLDRRGKVVFYDAVFKRDVKVYLDLALKYGVAVEFTLLDYLAAGRAKKVKGVWVGGRGALFTNPAVRQAFVTDFVVPFLQEFGQHPALAVLDTGNEFEWLVSPQEGGDHLEIPVKFRTPKPIPLKDILEYHNAVSQAVRTYAPRLLVTGPFNSANHSGLWKHLKGSVDYLAAHIYAHKWGAPMSAWMDVAAADAKALELPIALEEFSTAHEDPAAVTQMAKEKGFIVSGAWNMTPGIDPETADAARWEEQLERWRALIQAGGGAFGFLLLAGGAGLLMGATGFESAQIAAVPFQSGVPALAMLGLMGGMIAVRRGAVRAGALFLGNHLSRAVASLFPAIERAWRRAPWPLKILLFVPFLFSVACGGRSNLLPGDYSPPAAAGAAGVSAGPSTAGAAGAGSLGGVSAAGGQAGQSPVQGGQPGEVSNPEDPIDSSFVVDGTAYHHRPGYNFTGNVLDLEDGSTSAAAPDLYSGLPWQIVTVDGHRYIFSADGLFKINIFNIDDPASLQLVGTVDLGNAVHSSFVVFRDRIYVVSEETQGQGPTHLLTYDISSLAAPRLLGNSLLPFFPYTMDVLDGSSLVVGEHPAAGPARLVVLDTRNPANVTAGQAFSPAPPPLERIHIDRGLKRLYALSMKELQIWDLSTAAAPRRLSVLGGLPYAQDFDVHVQNGKTYVITTGESGEGIMLVDATNPAAPTAVLKSPFNVRIQGRDVRVMQVRAVGHTLHAAGRATMTMGPNAVDDFSVHMEIDILNPSSPRLDKVVFLDGAPAGYDETRDVTPAMHLGAGQPMTSGLLYRLFGRGQPLEAWITGMAPKLETTLVGGLWLGGYALLQLVWHLLGSDPLGGTVVYRTFSAFAAYFVANALFMVLHREVLERTGGEWIPRRATSAEQWKIFVKGLLGIHMPLLGAGFIFAMLSNVVRMPVDVRDFLEAGSLVGMIIVPVWMGWYTSTSLHWAYNKLAAGQPLTVAEGDRMAWSLNMTLMNPFSSPNMLEMREMLGLLVDSQEAAHLDVVWKEKNDESARARRDELLASVAVRLPHLRERLGITIPLAAPLLARPLPRLVASSRPGIDRMWRRAPWPLKILLFVPLVLTIACGGRSDLPGGSVGEDPSSIGGTAPVSGAAGQAGALSSVGGQPAMGGVGNQGGRAGQGAGGSAVAGTAQGGAGTAGSFSEGGAGHAGQASPGAAGLGGLAGMAGTGGVGVVCDLDGGTLVPLNDVQTHHLSKADAVNASVHGLSLIDRNDRARRSGFLNESRVIAQLGDIPGVPSAFLLLEVKRLSLYNINDPANPVLWGVAQDVRWDPVTIDGMTYEPHATGMHRVDDLLYVVLDYVNDHEALGYSNVRQFVHVYHLGASGLLAERGRAEISPLDSYSFAPRKRMIKPWGRDRFLVVTDGGIRVVDAASLAVLSTIPAPAELTAMAVVGDRLYMAAGLQGTLLHVHLLTDPDPASKESSTPLRNGVNRIFQMVPAAYADKEGRTTRTVLFLAGYEGVSAVDLADPSAPAPLANPYFIGTPEAQSLEIDFVEGHQFSLVHRTGDLNPMGGDQDTRSVLVNACDPAAMTEVPGTARIYARDRPVASDGDRTIYEKERWAVLLGGQEHPARDIALWDTTQDAPAGQVVLGGASQSLSPATVFIPGAGAGFRQGGRFVEVPFTYPTQMFPGKKGAVDALEGVLILNRDGAVLAPFWTYRLAGETDAQARGGRILGTVVNADGSADLRFERVNADYTGYEAEVAVHLNPDGVPTGQNWWQLPPVAGGGAARATSLPAPAPLEEARVSFKSLPGLPAWTAVRNAAGVVEVSFEGRAAPPAAADPLAEGVSCTVHAVKSDASPVALLTWPLAALGVFLARRSAEWRRWLGVAALFTFARRVAEVWRALWGAVARLQTRLLPPAPARLDPLGDVGRPGFTANRLRENLLRLRSIKGLVDVPHRALSQNEVRRALWDLFTSNVALGSDEDVARAVNALRQEPALIIRAAADFARSREDFEEERWLSPLLETLTVLSGSHRDVINLVNDVMVQTFGMNRVRGDLRNFGTAYVEARGAESDVALLARVEQLTRETPDVSTAVFMVVGEAVSFRRALKNMRSTDQSLSRALSAALSDGRLILVEEKSTAALNPLEAIRRGGGEEAVQAAVAQTLTVLAANPSLLDLTGLGELVRYLIQLINGQTLQVPAGKMGEVLERDRRIKQFA